MRDLRWCPFCDVDDVLSRQADLACETAPVVPWPGDILSMLDSGRDPMVTEQKRGEHWLLRRCNGMLAVAARRLDEWDGLKRIA